MRSTKERTWARSAQKTVSLLRSCAHATHGRSTRHRSSAASPSSSPTAALVHGEHPFCGHDKIRAHLAELTDATTWAGGQHHIGQLLIERAEPSSCWMRSYGRVTVRHRDGTVAFRAFGQYHDHCVQVEGAWLFAERRWATWEADRIGEYGRWPEAQHAQAPAQEDRARAR